METINLNDEGTQIIGRIKDHTGAIYPISTATVKNFIFRKPNGSTITRECSFLTNGTDGIMIYTTLSGDIDQIGRWEIKAYIETPTSKKTSLINDFMVK